MGKVVEVEEKEEERQKWSNPIEFLLSCIAMSVSLLTTYLDTHVTVNLSWSKTSSKPRKMRFEGGKTSTRKTENLVHWTYPHAECGMQKN